MFWYIKESQPFSWCFMSPKVVIGEQDERITHFVNKIHITRGLEGVTGVEIFPLCNQYNPQEYRGKRLAIPVMDESNVCVPCLSTMKHVQLDALIQCPHLLVASGFTELRGESSTTALKQALAHFTEYVIQSRIIAEQTYNQQNAQWQALLERLNRLGVTPSNLLD